MLTFGLALAIQGVFRFASARPAALFASRLAVGRVDLGFVFFDLSAGVVGVAILACVVVDRHQRHARGIGPACVSENASAAGALGVRVPRVMSLASTWRGARGLAGAGSAGLSSVR